MQFDDISPNEITEVIKATINWKAPEVDNIKNAWFKKFGS